MESAAGDQTSAWDQTLHLQLCKTIKAAKMTQFTHSARLQVTAFSIFKTDLLVLSKLLSQSCFKFVI